MKFGILSAAFLLTFSSPVLTGCSNPFSGSAPDSGNPYHSKNVNCNRLDLSGDQISVPLIRGVIHCLNTNQEINAAEQFLEAIPDQELQGLADWMNAKARTSPQTFFAAKEMFLRIEKDGRLEEILKDIRLVLQNEKNQASLAGVMSKLEPALTDFLTGSVNELDGKNVYVITSSKAYVRLFKEHANDELLSNLLRSTHRYLGRKDAVSVQQLYRILSRNAAGEGLKDLTATRAEQHIQKVAAFFSWLFTGDHYDTFSRGTSEILKNGTIQCFNGSLPVQDPIDTILKQLSRLSAAEAKQYLSHDAINLFLFAKGYCDFPYQTTALFNLLREGVMQPGFEESFTLLRPLLDDPAFIRFAGSAASREWVSANRDFAQGSFFRDFFTLLYLNQLHPLSSNGEALARLIDQGFTLLSVSELTFLFDVMKPWFTAGNQYGSSIAKLWFGIQAELSSEFSSGVYSHEAAHLPAPDFKSLLHSAFTNPYLASVLKLGDRLIESHQLTGLLHDGLQFFNSFLERGKHAVRFTSIHYPEFRSSHPYHWLLMPLPMAVDQARWCDLSTDWNFRDYSAANPEEYDSQMRSYLKCLNPNETFKSAFELYEYSRGKIHGSGETEFNYFLRAHDALFIEAVTLDLDLLLKTSETLVTLRPSDYAGARDWLNWLSRLTKTLTPVRGSLPSLTYWISERAKESEPYLILKSWFDEPEPQPVRPALDLMKQKTVNASVTQKETLENVSYTHALKAMFDEFCPSMNADDRECEIEPDQVRLYLRSPLLLADQIKEQYLASFQTWLDPAQISHWDYSGQTVRPETTGDVRYHSLPALHEIAHESQAVSGIFEALRQLQKDHLDFADFLRSRATQLTLIPYIFENPDYPAKNGHQFHDRIRLRLVSELDRLELIANNADFKGFGLAKNFGLGFIREIGLSWGDEPQALWPETLTRYIKPVDVATMAETSAAIKSQLSKFDQEILQKLGSCDARGRKGLGRWMVSHFCNKELSDISARIFNLRYLVSLLDTELPQKDGGKGGLLVLRDLFYQIYASNSSRSQDHFPNGVRLTSACFSPVVSESRSGDRCDFDTLMLISRITHLGLLHELGISYLRDDRFPITETIALLNRASLDESLQSHLQNFLASSAGRSWIENGMELAFTSPEPMSGSIRSLVRIANHAKKTRWFKSLVVIAEQNPNLLPELHDAVAILLSHADEFDRFAQHIDASRTMQEWIDVNFGDHDDKMTAEISNYLKSRLKVAATMNELVNEGRHIDTPRFGPMRPLALAWLDRLASDHGRNARLHLSGAIQDGALQDFCEVFSDAGFVDKTYNFLESVNQNSDSLQFLRRCEEFLSRP